MRNSFSESQLLEVQTAEIQFSPLFTLIWQLQLPFLQQMSMPCEVTHFGRLSQTLPLSQLSDSTLIFLFLTAFSPSKGRLFTGMGHQPDPGPPSALSQ